VLNKNEGTVLFNVSFAIISIVFLERSYILNYEKPTSSKCQGGLGNHLMLTAYYLTSKFYISPALNQDKLRKRQIPPTN
jgi:hypothetical protein